LLIYKRTDYYIATRVAHALCGGHLSRLRIQRSDGFFGRCRPTLLHC